MPPKPDEKAALLQRYRQLRAISRKLHTELMGQLSKDVYTECANKLGLLVEGTLVFDNEEEMSVVMDYCLYEGWKGEHNTITLYRDQQPYPPGSDETMLLEAMACARYSLFQVESVANGVGVIARDVLRGESGSLVDEGLGATAIQGVVFACHLVVLPEMSMTTGAALPIDADTLEDIINTLENSSIQIDPSDGSPFSRQQQAEMAAIIIRCALARGESSQIRYLEPRQPAGKSRSSPRQVIPFTGRNAPCPCGSGRKFKNCCGRP